MKTETIRFKHVIIAFLVCAFSLYILPLEAQEIPEEVRERAKAHFDTWREDVLRKPSYYGIVGQNVDLEFSNMREGYIRYLLWEHETELFAKSTEPDPTKFARDTLFVFPITADTLHVGSIVVCRNKNIQGKNILKEGGNFIIWGYHQAGNKIDEMALALSNIYPRTEGYSVSLAKMSGGNAGIHFIIRSNAGYMWIAPYDERAANAINLQARGEGANIISLHEVVGQWKSRIKENMPRKAYDKREE